MKEQAYEKNPQVLKCLRHECKLPDLYNHKASLSIICVSVTQTTLYSDDEFRKASVVVKLKILKFVLDTGQTNFLNNLNFSAEGPLGLSTLSLQISSNCCYDY